MKKHISRPIVLAITAGFLALAGNPAQAQTTDPLLTDSVDQFAFPIIITQPVDQAVVVGSNAVISVQAVDADGYQWQSNGVAMDGQTNSILTIQNVGINNAAAYSCNVSQSGGDAVPTRAASLNVVVAEPSAVAASSSSSFAAASMPAGGPIVVFGMPRASGGTQGGCPGSYAGYINYTKTIAQGWGWAPATNTTTVFTASDGGGRTDTIITYLGKYGDSGCDRTTITLPETPPSPTYRFTIFFPNNVPTTNYPIILSGFN